jgi:hypothetical protein
MDEEVKDVAFSIFDFSRISAQKSTLKPMGSLLVASYLFGKALNILIICANTYFLNSFVGLGNPSWAFTVSVQFRITIIFGFRLLVTHWPVKIGRRQAIFRAQRKLYVTFLIDQVFSYCDINFKMLGQQQKKTVQCLLVSFLFMCIHFWPF